MSRDLDDLHPELRDRCLAWQEDCNDLGLDVFIVHTYRSNEEQEALWRLGRNESGEIVDRSLVVTDAKPGESKHNHKEDGIPCALAFDYAFRDHEPWAQSHPWGVAIMLGVERHRLRHIAHYDTKRQRFYGDLGHLEMVE